MSKYIECVECEFVLLAGSEDEPVPKRVADCPNCGGSEFDFVTQR